MRLQQMNRLFANEVYSFVPLSNRFRRSSDKPWSSLFSAD